jgi:hypothetical protein
MEGGCRKMDVFQQNEQTYSGKNFCMATDLSLNSMITVLEVDLKDEVFCTKMNSVKFRFSFWDHI